jgi:hypothetical protein
MSATQRILSTALRQAQAVCVLDDQVTESQFSDSAIQISEKKVRVKNFRYGTASFLSLCGFLLPLILRDRISVVVAFFLPYWFLSQLARMQHTAGHATN